MNNALGTSTQFDPVAYELNNAKALAWFGVMAKQFGLIPLTGQDDKNQTLKVEMYKAGDVLVYDRRYPRIFRSIELGVRNTGWDTGHWTINPLINVEERKLSSPAAVYIQFSGDGTHALAIRIQDVRKGLKLSENKRGEELMGEVNTYNAVFLEKVNGLWRECKTCSSKWCDEDGATSAQRSIKRMLGIRRKR